MLEELNLVGLNEKIYYYKTKTGLPVYMWVNEKIKSMHASLSVRYGSVHTSFKKGKKTFTVPDGTAHYLEHVKFNIDENTTAHDEFLKLGGDANAFTTFKYTSYIVFATENKCENLRLLLDFVYNPFFTKKLVNKERGIITEEAAMGQDDPYTICFFKSLSNIFSKLKYKDYITGTKEEIEKITVDDLNLVYDTFYHPENMFLIITGNFNPYEMAKVAEETLSEKTFNEYENPIIIKENEPQKVAKEYEEEFVNISYPRIKYQVKLDLNKFSNISYYEIKLLSNLIMNINFGGTSTLRDNLMQKNLITSMYASTDIYDDFLVLSVTASTDYIDEVVGQIDKTFHNLKVTKEDYLRKRNAGIASLILQFENIETVNTSLQDNLINEGKIITDMKDRIESITLSDLESIIDLIDLDNKNITIFKPQKNQD